MKNNKILIEFSLFLLFGIFVFDPTIAENKPKDVTVFGSHAVYEYNDLVDEANVIALVKVNDDLSQKNSTIVYLGNSPLIKYHYATREVEVLEYYKNDLGLGEKIKFNEPVAITPNNEYIHTEEYNALEKNKKYIVYLSNNNGLGALSLISRNNGKVDLENFSKNEYRDVAVKSILRANGIKISQSSKIIYDNSDKNNAKTHVSNKVERINLNQNRKIELPIYYNVDNYTQTEYFDIQGVEFYVEAPDSK